MLHLIVEARPHAGQAVGLQLHAHLQSVDLTLVAALQCLLLEGLHLVCHAEQSLHVMADLVGDHVGLREIAGRMKPVLQLSVEVEIDVKLVVERTIERAHRRLARAAARRARGAGEQHQRRLLVALAGSLEDAVPDNLRIRQHAAHEVRHLIVLRAHALSGARKLEGRAGARAGARNVRQARSAVDAAKELQGVDAQHQADATDDEQRGDAEAAATNRDGDPAHAAAERAAALTPAVLHVVAFPVIFTVAHASHP